MATPTSAGGQPTSFKTNVNRAKTKRWVEAKSYAYDGDDWGDVDDYDEYGGYEEPPSERRPTGLRQRGQSASQPPQEGYGQDPFQSPVSRPQEAHVGSQDPQSQVGGRNMAQPILQRQQALPREDSFENGDERRAFPAGAPQSGGFGAPTQVHPQDPRSFQGQQRYPEPSYAEQPLQSNSGSPLISGPPPPRRSMEGQPIYYGHSATTSRGPQQPRFASSGSRTHSMTSNTSSLDFHNRRDFSPSAMPPPLQTRESPSPHNDSRQPPPRKSNLSQQAQPVLPFDPHLSPPQPIGNRSASQSRERAGSSSSAKVLPFVRPADIYKRVEEEREKLRQSQESSRPSMDALLGKPNDAPNAENTRENDSSQRLKPTLDSVTERKNEYGLERFNVGDQANNVRPDDISDKPQTTSKKFDIKKSSQSRGPSRHSTRLVLPDPTRVSGFGEDFGESFMGSDDAFGRFSQASSSQGDASSKSEDVVSSKRASELQHQPSKGFTSAVHQAFDTAQDQVPPTPSSTADSSVGRSASGGTSTVSPIMSRGPSAVDRDRDDGLPSIDDVTTPTQDEHGENPSSRQRSAGSFGTLTQASGSQQPTDEFEEPPPNFKMGHRRESNPPIPDNSPAKTPALASMSHLRHPQQVDLADTTPTPTDSVPSTSNSFREVESPASPDATDGTPKAFDLTAQNASSQFFVDSPTSPAHSFLHQRADSSGSDRVRNLAEKFENSSRPESPNSNTTPRASILGLGTSGKNDMAPPSPLNERVDSFRPQLPGGWESSASIGPTSAPTTKSDSSVSKSDSQQEAETVFPGLAQAKDASSSAFSAAAEAGSALAGALVAAVGIDESSTGEDDPHAPTPRDRSVSANTVVHPEVSRPLLVNLPDDDSNAPTPLPKDTPRQPGTQTSASEYFSHYNEDEEEVLPTRPANEAKQPQTLPALSTNMDQQYESDRLRREIVRELVPGMPSEPTTAESDSPYQASSRYPTNETVRSAESETLPNEYDSYWNDDSDDASSTSSGEQGNVVSATTAQAQQGAVVVENPPAAPANGSSAPSIADVPTMANQDPTHNLAHRFSWEQPLADLAPSSQPAPIIVPPVQHTEEVHRSDFLDAHIYPPKTSTAPRSTISDAPASVEALSSHTSQHESAPFDPEKEPQTNSSAQHHDSRSLMFDSDHGSPNRSRHVSASSGKESPNNLEKREVRHSLSLRNGSIPSSHHPERDSIAQTQPPQIRLDHTPPPPPAANTQPKLPAFREIMALKTPADRIRVFNETQKIFANMNTGLLHWLSVTSSTLPEHVDVVNFGGRTGASGPGHKPSPSRSKLSGLITGGQSGQPSSQQYIDASPSPHAPGGLTSGSASGANASQGLSPTGGPAGKISGQQVQAKSKELLHSAGIFGGKANVAAKGLFSKGKSKLRDASGSKKASPLAIPPLTPGLTSRGMPSQHVASQISHAQPRAQPMSDHSPPKPDVSAQHSQTSIQINRADSERVAPSVQSITQSQLADDERSEESTVEKGDRLPRSSKIYLRSDSSRNREGEDKDEAVAVEPKQPFADEDITRNRKPKKGHRSTGTSSNKTPTQATFDRAIVPDLPPEDRRMESPTDLHRDKPGQDQAGSRAPQAEDCSAERRSSSHDPGRVKTRTLHGDDLPRLEAPLVDQEHTFPYLHVDPQELSKQFHSNKKSSSPNPGTSSSPSAPIGEHRTGLRLPSQDLSVGRPSMDSLPGRNDLDRPPSPVSPQLPIQLNQDARGRRVVPVHHGIDHDFGSESEVERARRRSSSFSRPFHESENRRRSQDPDLQNHLVYRRTPSTEDLAMPAAFYPETIPRSEAPMPRQQAPEYALGGVGPDLPPTEAKLRSRRGSRSSTFLKSLRKSFTDSDSPPMPNSSDQLDGSPTPSTTHLESRSKRSSIFHRGKSQTDITRDDSRSKENVAPISAPRSRSPTVTQLPAPKAPPKPTPHEDDDEFPMRPRHRGSMGINKKLQRASTEATKSPEVGKKKRFSAIGSLFGKSNQKRLDSSQRPSLTQSRNPSQSLPPTQEVRDTYEPPQPSNGPPYHEPTPTYMTQPPNEGYYAPKRGSPLQYVPVAPVASPFRNLPPQTSRDNAPAYVQDSMLRQSASPPPSAKPAKGARASVDFFRKASQAGLIEPSSVPPRGNSREKGRSWGHLSKRSRSRSRNSGSAPKKEESPTPQLNSFTGSPAPRQDPRSESPPPPPPPPKDEWHRARPRQSSLGPPAHLSSQITVPPAQDFTSSMSEQQRQYLPPLQTNVPSPHLGPIRSGLSSGETKTGTSEAGLNSEDKRRSRQQEIEIGHLSPRSAGMSPEEKRRSRQMDIEMSPVGDRNRASASGLREVGEDDEPIKMSATSFPGQEWQPGYNHGWLAD